MRNQVIDLANFYTADVNAAMLLSRNNFYNNGQTTNVNLTSLVLSFIR